LQSGDRARAAELAEQAPSLRESYKLLNFPERNTWFGLCEGVGVPSEDALDGDLVTEVVSQLSAKGPDLESLLARHRRLALELAPIQDRLQVLRLIREADKGNSSWDQDLREYERQRFRELKSRANDADKQGDLRTLEAIGHELRSGEWLEPRTSRSLVRFVEKRIRPHRRKLAVAKYTELSERIREAQGKVDEAQCRELFGEWEAVQGQTGFGPGRGLADQVASAREWLDGLEQARDEETAFQKACDVLEEAIDKGRGLSALRRLAGKALGFDRGMPDVLAARYNSRARELERLGKRKFALLMTGTVIGLVAIALGIAKLAQWRGHVSELNRWTTPVAAALERNELERARRLLDEIGREHPALAREPEIRDLDAKCQQQEAREEARRAEFNETVSSLEAEWNETPTPAVAEQRLKRATQLARMQMEKDQVEAWRQRIETYEDQQRQELEAKYRAELEELEAAFSAVVAAQDKSPEELDLAAIRCETLAAKLIQSEGCPGILKGQARAMRKDAQDRVREAREGASKEVAAQRALRSTESAWNNPALLAGRLRSFAQDYPEHPWAADLAQAAELESEWVQVREWESIAVWGGTIEVATKEAADSRFQRITKYCEDYPRSPYHAAAQEYLEYLAKASNVLTDDGEPRYMGDVLGELSGKIYSSNVYMVRAKTGETYYYFRPEGADENRDSHSFRYIIHWEGMLSPSSRVLARAQLLEKPRRAPHVEFAQQAMKRLEGVKFNGREWPFLYLELAELARKTEDIDPIHRATLVKYLFSLAQQCAPWEADEFRRRTNKLEDALPNYNLSGLWMDPKNQDANKAREEIRNALRLRVPSFDGLVVSIKEKLAKLDSSLRPYQVAGIMLGERGEVRLKRRIRNGGLYVLRSVHGKAFVFRRIGSVTDGTETIDGGVAGLNPRGGLVFVREKQGP